MRPKIRQDDQILAAAAQIACKVGYQSITREAVAKAVGCSPAVISHRWSTMAQFKRALMRYAVRVPVLPIVAQGLAVRDSHACKAPASIQQRARGSI